MDGRGLGRIQRHRAARRKSRRSAARRHRAAGPGGRHRRRAGRPAGRHGPDLQPVLHDEAAGLGAGPRDRPQDRRCARRTDRRERHPSRGHALPRHAAGRAIECSGNGSRVRGSSMNRARLESYGTDSGGRRSRFASARHRPRAVGRASRRRRGAERQRRDREAARGAVRRRPERPEDGRQRRHGRAAHGQGAAPDHRGHPDDGVRLGPHGGRGDEDRRLRLRAEAVRDRGDGAQGREGHRAPPPQARDRVPAPHAAGHLRLRPHRRRERRAAVGARRS